MKPSLSDILPLLNANCGDVLKAVLLHQLYPDLPKINPLYLKAPTGDIEAAFAAFKSFGAPEDQASKLLAAIKADHARLEDDKPQRVTDPQVERLVRDNATAVVKTEMPASVRFEDVESARVTEVLPQFPNADEEISAEEAASLYGYSYVGLLNRLKASGIVGRRRPGGGLTKYYPRAKVETVCGAKGKHVR